MASGERCPQMSDEQYGQNKLASPIRQLTKLTKVGNCYGL